MRGEDSPNEGIRSKTPRGNFPDPVNRQEQLLAAAAALSCGEIVVYPTETVYGLGVDAGDAGALSRLVELKGRDASKGMAVLVSGLEMATPLLARSPLPEGAALAERFWPGPLTLVLPAAPSVPESLRGAGGGIGLRCSSDDDARVLLALFGRPLTSTSANPSGAEAALCVEQARDYFGDKVAVYLDGGARGASAPSSVVEFLDGRAYLRRVGSVSRADIESVVELHSEERSIG